MKLSLPILTLVLGITHATGAIAHEFWIEAEAETSAHLRVGQMLEGETLPFLDKTILSARHFAPTGEQMLSARQGDIPALTIDLTKPGLHQITVETKPAYVVFADLAEFEEYLDYEGLQSTVAQHKARGLPNQEIAEEYFRYARSLVQIGTASNAFSDVASGLRHELVALTSPFAQEVEAIDLQLLWEGRPKVSAQISLLHRTSDDPPTVTRHILRSDADGKVVAPINGPGLYVFNAVHIMPTDGPGSVVWQSHWASLSFEIQSKVSSE